MSESFAYIDIIFFAMVAAFIALRLRNVLGRKTGNERRRAAPSARVARPAEDNVVTMPERRPDRPLEETSIANVADDQVKRGLTDIRLADPSFDLDGFIEGARSAFGMVIEAFARGDRETLRPLLADDVFGSFEAAISERERAGHVFETQIVNMPRADIIEAGMIGRNARITVRFCSEQINVMRNAEGHVVDGDAARIDEVTDIWSFERDTRSSDPNWTLVETRTPS